MTVAGVAFLIAVVVVGAVVIGFSRDRSGRSASSLRQLDDVFATEAARQNRDAAEFLIELHRENRAAYRRIKEAGKNR